LRSARWIGPPPFLHTTQLKLLIGETARLSFHEVHPSITPAEARAGRVPVGFKVYHGADKREGEYLLRDARGARR
jgi:preprotein translocase subunit SecD